jgi:hypothetical protein
MGGDEMASRIQLKVISFYEAEDNTTHNFRGDDGYTIGSKGGVAVTFQITELSGDFIQLTEVVNGTYPSFDALVHRAYTQLKKRLEGYGTLSEHILPEPAVSQSQ